MNFDQSSNIFFKKRVDNEHKFITIGIFVAY